MTAVVKPELIWIAGPCMLESEALVYEVSTEVAELATRYPTIDFIFKGSFDKANRTSLTSERGPGIKQGLAWLAEVKARTGLKVTTDVHLPSEVAEVAEVCDILQIPAFLSRQTDLLVAAAATGRIVNVKKGQFLAPDDMKHAVKKCRESGAGGIWLTERGFTFGYHNLVVDMRSFPIMARTGCPTILDATHSVQLPGGGDGHSGGEREFVRTLARSAIAAGADGLFTEIHPDPDNALSDAACQLPLSSFAEFVEDCLRLRRAVGPLS
jgi:2-dehydro-3-deoxyphosphooctonate aldolase (KDO 8-P synthase)